MGFDNICPDCGHKLKLDIINSRASCSNCGYHRESLSGFDEKAEEVKAKGPRHNVTITYKGEINPRALTVFNTGHDCIFQGDRAKALACFERAAEIQPDFVDAHLWIAETAEDEATKRKHLGIVLAYVPNHLDALRKLMVLDGELTPAEAEQTYHYNEQRILHAAGAVGMSTESLACPVCGGDLTVNDQTGQVTCKFCGFTEKREPRRAEGVESLTKALLKRKAQPTRWEVGERLLHCNHCGAERTIPGTDLSTRCAFCGSHQVIVQDALASFQQPDGLIPFTVNREQAEEAIRQQLNSISERIAGWFNSNKVKRATLNGYYLPFWTFDALVQVTVNKTPKEREPRDNFNFSPPQPTSMVTMDGVNNLFVSGVKSPPEALLAKTGDFDVHMLEAYDPHLLAEYPAQIYAIDFDKASLEARGMASSLMRSRHHDLNANDSYDITIWSTVVDMQFQLVLAPVWIAALLEDDGDVRTAVVNGQTGRAALGKAHKPD